MSLSKIKARQSNKYGYNLQVNQLFRSKKKKQVKQKSLAKEVDPINKD